MKRRSQTVSSGVPAKKSTDNIVKLNLGGTIFQTTKSTLTKFDGFFKAMLESEVPITKDESVAIFIDRDPAHFPLILNYMRDGHVELPSSVAVIKQIQNEAQFYLLEDLVGDCQEAAARTEEIVRLNVGGTVFHTTKMTLTTLSGYFRTLFDSEYPSDKDESGAVFVDRDPAHFGPILSYMRDGHLDLPECTRDVERILDEAEFYRAPYLKNICKAELKKRTDQSAEAEESETWEIFIQFLAGKRYTLKVSPTDTIDDVLSMISDRQGIPVHKLRLIFEGRRLYEGSDPLSRLNVEDGSTLHLVLGQPHFLR